MTIAMRIGILSLVIGAALLSQALTAKGDIVERLLPIVMMAESSGNPLAEGNGSWGLYQLTSVALAHFNQVNGADYQKHDLFDPEINEEIARWYLGWINSYLTRKGYPDDPARIVFCFNTGVGKLRRNDYRLPSWTLNHPNRIYRRIYREGL